MTMKILAPFLTITAAAVLLAGFTTARADHHEKETLEVGGLTFSFSEPWEAKEQPRAMSQGGITHPSEVEGAIIEADFYHFGAGQGGGVQANVQRWLGQFEGEVEAETATIEAGGLEITLVKASGTYMDGPPLGQRVARPDYGLLGAIIDRPEEGSVFIKLTGPKDEVAELEESFKDLTLSAFEE